MKYTLEESIKYSKQGKIEEWVQSFLRDDKALYASPNYALADGLNLEERFYYGPVEFYLYEITPIRVEDDLSGNELEYYSKVVDRMANDFNGNNFPPLILEYRNNKFYLTDGNHRYSTLKRLGIDKYYSIIWGNKELENEIQEKYEKKIRR